jgi:hypothetical protein
MEHTRAKSFRNCSGFSKLPEILHKNKIIRNNFKHPTSHLETQTYSYTPEPALKVKVMKIHDRSQAKKLSPDKIDSFTDITTETISDFIKNNAVTFISPNDLINQLQIESMSTTPKQKNPDIIIKNSSINKLKNFDETNSYPISNELFYDSKLFRDSLIDKKPKRVSSKIEVAGKKVTKFFKRPNENRSGDIKGFSNINHSLTFCKDIDQRRSPNPVLSYNKKHKYLRGFCKESSSIIKSTQIFFVPSSNLKIPIKNNLLI